MADPASRKSARLNRLRSQLRRKRESLADHFDFRMYVAFVFKDKVRFCYCIHVSTAHTVDRCVEFKSLS